MTPKAVFLFAVCAGTIVTWTPAAALTATEADTIVAAEAAAEKNRQVKRQAQLQEVPAIRETVIRHGERTLVVRNVETPAPVESSGDQAQEVSQDAEVSSSSTAEVKRQVNLTLVATVTGNGSEIRVRGPDSQNSYTVVSGITHLPAVFRTETPQTRYTFFAIVTQGEAITASPEPMPEPGYAIYTDGPPIPESFRSTIAVLHDHYHEHEAVWKAEAERAKILQAARERLPAEPEPVTTLNVWRVRGNTKNEN